MEDRAKDFLKSIYKCDETCSVNFKPYEYGSLVETIPFQKALKKFMNDFEEMKEFFKAFNILDEEKAFQATCNIWKNHIYISKFSLCE